MGLSLGRPTQAVTPERAAELYRTASTPQEASLLIEYRGRPKLALLVQTFARVPSANVSAQLFRAWARHVATGSGRGWFEPEERERPTHKSAAQVSAIFVWLGDVFDRYAPLQPPPPAEGPIVDVCETCGAPLRPGVDCCVPPVKRLQKRRSKMSR